MLASPAIQTRPVKARLPFTVPLERYVLLPVLAAGFALAVMNYLSYTRLPNYVYLAFAVLQLCVVGIQVLRRNLLAGTMGLCLTTVLVFAVLIERAPFKDFDAILTPVVYRYVLVSTSFCVLLATTCLYHALTLRFVPDRPWIWTPADPAEKSFGNATTWIFYVIGTALLAVTVPGGFISEVGYGTAAYMANAGALAGSGGLTLLGAVFITFSVVAASRLYGFHSTRFRMAACLAVGSMLYFRILRGGRGASIGLFATLAFLYYMNSKLRPWKRAAVLACAAGAVLFFFNMLAEVRATAHLTGIGEAVTASTTSSKSLLNHPMQFNMIPQSYWHLLHCVDLYQMSVRLDGRTFLDLIPEAIPEDITRFFGIKRPISSPWLLAGYRVHGGGLFVVAEGFWNFGMPGALLVAGVMALIAIKLEHWFRQQEPILACSYFAFLGTFGFGTYYGLQTFARAFETAIVLALIMRFGMRFYRRRFNYRMRVAFAMESMRREMAGATATPKDSDRMQIT